MMEKISHRMHKTIIFITVFIVLVSMIMIGMKVYSDSPYVHGLTVLNFALTFVNTVMIIILVSIIVKLEENFFYHHKKLEDHHDKINKHHEELKKSFNKKK
jgi:uncharacterized membrane protein